MKQAWKWAGSLMALLLVTEAHAQSMQRQVMPLNQYRALMRQGGPTAQLRQRPVRSMPSRPAPSFAPPPPPAYASAPPPEAQPFSMAPPAPMAYQPPVPVEMAPPPPQRISAPVAYAPRPAAPRLEDIPPPVRRSEPTRAPAAAPAAPASGTYFDSREVQAAKHAYPPALDVAVSGGYRRSKASISKSSIVTSATDPRVTTEEKWKGLNAYQARAEASYTQRRGLLKGVHVEGSAYTTGTFAGDYRLNQLIIQDQQEDLGNDLEGDAGDGDMQGFRGAVGYAFELTNPVQHDDIDQSIWLTPVLGYGVDTQNYEVSDVSQNFPAIGALPNRRQNNEMEWKGTFIGLGLDGYLQRNKYHFSVRGEYHFGDFEGSGRLMAPELPGVGADRRFSQAADATGILISSRFGYQAFENTELFVSATVQRWTSDQGNEIITGSDGSTANQNLDEADARSSELMFGAALRF